MKWMIKKDVSMLGTAPEAPLGLAPLTLELLRLRGYSSAEEQLDFLRQKNLEDLSDFCRLPDMGVAVKTVRQAIDEHKKIWVYGDYDADGMTATALLIKALAFLGCKADYYIPHRVDEGYGLHVDALRLIKEQGADLLVTVDCGISAVTEVAFATDIGLPLIITDHHQPGDILPEAAAVVNPELMEFPGKSRGLAGAGVAFALAYCLLQTYGLEEKAKELAQYAAIGTIADGMPLKGDNRVLVAYGLERINENPLPGIKAMVTGGNLDKKVITESHIAFTIAPRLNAAGRLDDPRLGAELLLADTIVEANPYISRMEKLNKQRQEIDAAIYGELINRINEAPGIEDKPVLIFAGEGWHIGVIGITATRLMERFKKPVILISFDGETGRGSGRSLAGYSLHHALSEASPFLIAFGGHEFACGLQITRDQLEPFIKQMENHAFLPEANDEGADEVGIFADLAVAFDQLSVTVVDELERIAPFGTENPRPLFVLTSMRLKDLRAMGQGKRHFQLFFQPTEEITSTYNAVRELAAIAFSMEDTMFIPQTGKIYDLLFQPEINEWQGRRTMRALLKDIRETEQSDMSLPDWETFRAKILGSYAFREKQIEALDSLASGKNTLLLMATGRGKTAVFQTAAAALNPKGISVIVYPLRSLARDQARRMEEILQPLGMRTVLAWGGLDHWEKRAFFNDLYQGRIQVVISTAEFLQAHLDKFSVVADCIGLFVVDEAHHLGDSHRQAYQHLHQTWNKLGNPLYLATTATADESCRDRIMRDFSIENLVIEDHCRENLAILDARGKDKEGKLAYLLKRITPDSKMIVYVNSRALTQEIYLFLQDNLPLMTNKIGYYHGGLGVEARQLAETAFRSGNWNVLVSTSAFGEGTDIPDIRDVALYHLCFSRAEYNQLSGRAGRDDEPAYIHLLYGEKDVEVNRLLLREEAPDRDVLGSLYLLLREKAAVVNPITLSDREIALEMTQRGFRVFTEKTAAYCLGTLEELALLLREEGDGHRDIHLAPPPPAKLDLMQSSLYREGLRETELFDEYLELAFDPDLSRLLAGINRPILPERRRNTK